jgi:hypothetical protein
MRKTFVLLWCTLAGCSIIPDDAFEEIPKFNLQKVTITSNLEPSESNLVSESLVGTLSTSASGKAINFNGNLDPFWFKSHVKRIEYELNSDNRLSSLIITFYNDSIRAESFTYNSEGKLLKNVLTSEDYESTLDFFYVDNVLDRIDKKVVDDGAVSYGFLMKVARDDYSTMYVSVFPYDYNFDLPALPTFPWYPPACSPIVDSNPNLLSWSTYVISFGRIEFLTPWKAGDLTYWYGYNAIDLQQNTSAISGKELQKDFMFQSHCVTAFLKLNYAQVIPEINQELEIATLFNSQAEVSETMGGTFSESRFADVQLKYEYSYDK